MPQPAHGTATTNTQSHCRPECRAAERGRKTHFVEQSSARVAASEEWSAVWARDPGSYRPARAPDRSAWPGPASGPGGPVTNDMWSPRQFYERLVQRQLQRSGVGGCDRQDAGLAQPVPKRLLSAPVDIGLRGRGPDQEHQAWQSQRRRCLELHLGVGQLPVAGCLVAIAVAHDAYVDIRSAQRPHAVGRGRDVRGREVRHVQDRVTRADHCRLRRRCERAPPRMPAKVRGVTEEHAPGPVLHGAEAILRTVRMAVYRRHRTNPYDRGGRETTAKSFGDLLRSHRGTAMLTQETLAARARLSLDAVSALERGVHPSPRIQTVVLLADALGLDAGQREELLVAARPLAARRGAARNGDLHEVAAWELYVELTTRIAVARLAPDQGLLRDALTSLHSLFGTTRSLLKGHGRVLAQRPPHCRHSVRSVAMIILDDVLRPFLSTWHPLLLDHEGRRPAGVPAAMHERAWCRNSEMRSELAGVRQTLGECAGLLATIAGLSLDATAPHPGESTRCL